MSVIDQVRTLVEPLVLALDAELYDLEHESGVLRVMVDRPGGIDVDTIGEVAQAVSEALDENDPFPDSRYLLEVTSPGIERKLRTPAHFAVQIGEEISLKLNAAAEGPRRANVTLLAADEQGITVTLEDASELQIPYADIEAARTIFHWGEQSTPKGRKSTGEPRSSSSSSTKKASAS